MHGQMNIRTKKTGVFKTERQQKAVCQIFILH